MSKTEMNETEALKNELLEQLGQLGPLVDRLAAGYQLQFPGPDQSELDAELRNAVVAAVQTSREVGPFAEEMLRNYASLPQDGRFQAQQKIRHDIHNQLTPLYGLSQEVEIVAPPESHLGGHAAELRQGCEAATRLLNFLTGKTENQKPVPVAPGGPSLTQSWVNAVEVDPAKILVADDNVSSAQQLSRHLSRQGHAVLVVPDGRQALQTLEEHRDIDLVLLDVMMPGLDGMQVLSWIKSHPELRHIAVIMISGLDDAQRTINCIACGAEDYLSKPINQVLLDARVGSCLRRQQAEKHRYQQYFSRDLAEELACNSEHLLRTRDAEVSILFCDIRRFSAISERVGAATTIDWIGSTMGALSRIVFAEQGVLIDYVGDGLMAMWGAPKPLDNHADLAVRAGLKMLDALRTLNKSWQSRLGESIQLGIGINSGSAHVGVIGSSPKFKYGPLGPTVNLASRVEGTTKYLQSSLVVSQHTKQQLKDRARYSIRRLCRARVINLKRPVSLYEVRGVDPQFVPVFETYQEALRLYETKQFLESARILGKLLASFEEFADVPSQMLMSRVLSAMADDTGFDPVWEFGK